VCCCRRTSTSPVTYVAILSEQCSLLSFALFGEKVHPHFVFEYHIDVSADLSLSYKVFISSNKEEPICISIGTNTEHNIRKCFLPVNQKFYKFYFLSYSLAQRFTIKTKRALTQSPLVTDCKKSEM